MNLKEMLYDETTKTKTENGALAFDTTKSLILDLFGIGGAGRNLSETVLYQKISQALAENLDLGLRCLLFLGDIRGGQGERRLFKKGIEVIIDTQKKDVVEAFLSKVPFYARWDYLFEEWLLKHPMYSDFIMRLIKKEMSSEKTSLIWKWLPKVHTHGVKKSEAKLIYTYLGFNEKEYRQLLSKKRAELKVVEVSMSANKWLEIDYSKVPSKASLLYREAFKRHDEDGYNKFIESVEKGEAKINASTIYPHEIVSKIWRNPNPTLEALWKSLPNFVKDENKNILPMVDVSGSMGITISPDSSVEAIHVSIGLGLYLAERMNGIFKDTFLTFSQKPQLQKIIGNSLYQRIVNLNNAEWQQNTNIVLAFETILSVAIKNNVKQKDLPSTIVVFSDMEFDTASNDKTPFDYIKQKYEQYGYKLPQVVFWNLNARNVHFPVRQNERGVILVSGYSPSTLQYILNGELKTPYELMVEVLNQPRYNIFE